MQKTKILSILLTIAFLLSSPCSFAATKKRAKKILLEKKIHKPISSIMVVDMDSGKILHQYNSRVKINPASLTKVMTLYLIFEQLKKKALHMQSNCYVSLKAQDMKPSKLGLVSGEIISVENVVLGLIIKSANDAAVVAAENIAGSEEMFAKLMNKKARQLGMFDTNFVNASGWHDPKQKTTATDLAKLTIAIKRDFPQFFHLFSKTEFEFKGVVVKGHNKITESYPWSNGLKTGYTSHAGFNLITTVTKHGKSLAGIVTGSDSIAKRDKLMLRLLNKYLNIKK